MDRNSVAENREVKVLYPADTKSPDTITERIWVLPVVGNENEGTGIILNDSVSGEDRFHVGDLATWISTSPMTQKAEIVASKHLPWRTFREFLAHDGIALAEAFHADHEMLRKGRAKTMHVFRCELCGEAGIGRVMPNDVWHAIIPAEHQSKSLCDSCINRFEQASREKGIGLQS